MEGRGLFGPPIWGARGEAWHVLRPPKESLDELSGAMENRWALGGGSAGPGGLRMDEGGGAMERREEAHRVLRCRCSQSHAP